MRPTNKFFAVVFLLAILVIASTPATSQPPLDKSPVIFSVERSSTGEIFVRAILVSAPCTGRYVAQTTLSPAVLDLSEMKVGQTRIFPTGWYARPGEFSIFIGERESIASPSCPYWQGGKFETITFTITEEGRLGNIRRLPGLDDSNNGRPFLNFSESQNFRIPPEIRFSFRFPSGNQTQLYVFQVFPNGTTTFEDIVAAPSPSGFGYSIVGFPMGRMTRNLPIYFVAIRDGVSTSGVVHTP